MTEVKDPSVKRSFITRPIFREGKWMLERTEYVKRFSTLEMRFLDEPKKITFEELKLNKSVSLTLIESRSGLDQTTMRTLTAFFKREMTIKVNEDAELIAINLANGRPILSHPSGVASEIGINQLLKGKQGLTVTLSDAVKISANDVNKLMANPRKRDNTVFPYVVEILNPDDPKEMDCRVTLPYEG